MRKKSFHKKDLLKRRKCKLTSSFLNFWVFDVVYQDRKPERVAYSINASFAKPFVERREERVPANPKKNLKENASEKSRFLQKCTFYCFSSLSLFAGINQSIIKPFPTTIESSTIKKSSKKGSFQLSIIARLWHLPKKKRGQAKKRRCPGQVDDGWKLLLLWLRHAGMKGIISWKVIPHRGISN